MISHFMGNPAELKDQGDHKLVMAAVEKPIKGDLMELKKEKENTQGLVRHQRMCLGWMMRLMLAQNKFLWKNNWNQSLRHNQVSEENKSDRRIQ